MENLKNLMESFETLTEEKIDKIVGNENVDASTLPDSEKLSVLVFSELEKALHTEDRKLILDCNYQKSKFHNRTPKQIARGLENEYLVNYFRLVSADKAIPMLHIWPKHLNTAKCTCTFEVHITSEVSSILAEREEEFNFTIKRRPDGTIRDVYRSGVQYDELVGLVNSLCALLTANAKAKAAKKEEKEKAKEKKSPKEVKEEPKAEEPKAESKPVRPKRTRTRNAE